MHPHHGRAGSVTPWKTHLGSEEEEPDARVIEERAKDTPDGQEWMEADEGPVVLYYLPQDDYPVPAENITNAQFLPLFKTYLYGYPWEVRSANAESQRPKNDQSTI
jgi:hypothetical protein